MGREFNGIELLVTHMNLDPKTDWLVYLLQGGRKEKGLRQAALFSVEEPV